jgi:hypothetical protein
MVTTRLAYHTSSMIPADSMQCAVCVCVCVEWAALVPAMEAAMNACDCGVVICGVPVAFEECVGSI